MWLLYLDSTTWLGLANRVQEGYVNLAFLMVIHFSVTMKPSLEYLRRRYPWTELSNSSCPSHGQLLSANSQWLQTCEQAWLRPAEPSSQPPADVGLTNKCLLLIGIEVFIAVCWCSTMAVDSWIQYADLFSEVKTCWLVHFQWEVFLSCYFFPKGSPSSKIQEQSDWHMRSQKGAKPCKVQ